MLGRPACQAQGFAAWPGGAAIDRFLLMHQRVAQLTTVEPEASLPRICREYFALGQFDPAVYQLATDTASGFMAAQHEPFDWIICDVHDGVGLPDDMLQEPLHAALSSQLAQHGVLCLNVADRRDPGLARLNALLGARFAHCWYAEVEGYENILIFAARQRFEVDAVRMQALQSAVAINIQALQGALIHATRPAAG